MWISSLGRGRVGEGNGCSYHNAFERPVFIAKGHDFVNERCLLCNDRLCLSKVGVARLAGMLPGLVGLSITVVKVGLQNSTWPIGGASLPLYLGNSPHGTHCALVLKYNLQIPAFWLLSGNM